jgi:hypothetical protein
MANYRAVFQDEKSSATYSAKVELRDGVWLMETSDGFQLITLHFDDDEAGRLTFSHYREEPEPVDLRLHLPERIGTESSFQQLQRAYVEKEIIAQRKHRQAARTEIQNVSPPDPAQVAAARRINQEYGALKNRHGLKNR